MNLEMTPAMAPLQVATIDATMLTEALDVESRLLGELGAVLRQQRDGVATDNADVVVESVIAAHRVMRTLDEARRRRRTVVGILAAAEDTPLEELDDALGPLMTTALVDARARLLEQARRVAREIEVTRRILNAAVEHGDRMLQAICGVHTVQSYEPSARPPSAVGGGVLIDQSV